MSDIPLPSLFIPHGGGPCFFMDEPFGPPGTWDEMADFLRSVAGEVGERPRALVVISAHWEADLPTVLTAPAPPLLYDYYGFPEHTYRLTYAAKGAPELASRLISLLAGAGIKAGEDTERGFDHGVFIPLKLIYPDADIPIVQISLRRDLDPRFHLDMGRALAPLRHEGVLILGSGLSFHNLRGFFSSDPRLEADARAFDTWLGDAVTEPERLIHWRDAPGALACHPRAEHLLPLMVVAGAGLGAPGQRLYTGTVAGKTNSAFRFG